VVKQTVREERIAEKYGEICWRGKFKRVVERGLLTAASV
jgi:hypothetical protein